MALVREKKQAQRAAQAAGRKARERRARVAGEAEAAEVRLPPWRELVGKGPREGQRSADEAAEAGAPPARVEAVPAEAKEDATPPEQAPAAAAEVPASEAPLVEETAPLEEPAVVEPPAATPAEAVELEAPVQTPAEAVEVAAAAPEPQAVDAPAVERSSETEPTKTPTPKTKEPPVLRWARGPGPLAADLTVVRRSLARSRGQSLPNRVESALPGLSPELSSGVTIHVDAAAAEAAEHLHAEAFTIGTHVYFASGRFDPKSQAGLSLLSHELAHVDQFREGRLHGLSPLSRPDDAVEHDATARARRLRMPPSPEGRATSEPEHGEPASPRHPTLIASPPMEGPLLRNAPILRRATDTARDFLGKPYFQQAEGWSEAGSAVDGALALDATATKDAFPSPKAELGPEARPSIPTAPVPTALGTAEQVPEPGTDTAQVQPEPTEAVAPPPTPSTPSLPTSADGDASAAQANFAAALDRVPTTLDGLSTDPGPPPDVALDGAADPALADEQGQATTEQVGDLHEQARANVDDGPGPEQVQPHSLHTELEVPEPTAPTSEGLGEVPRMAELDANETITEEVQAKTDELGQAQLDATLVEAKTQLDTAATDADEQRAEEVAKAEEENARLSENANAEQDRAVVDARADIETGREDTKREQQQQVDDAELKNQQERDDLQDDVDARVERDEGRIETELATAETRAETRKQAAESEAARKKDEAERESEDDSWWSRALSAIADAFEALTSLIGDIFDAAISAVGDIIDAAKSLAADIINAARQFVVSALQALGDVLKGLVDELLGDIFPELAAALNELIDDAVDLAVTAVNALVDGLIAGINALLDAIGGAITAILEAYRAAIDAALAFATALVTGDWEALGRMILEAVLQLAGIPPEEFYAFIAQAMGAIDTIVDDPGAFVGNVIDAVALGFQRFSDNFWNHLQTGFFEWIVGPLGELGITLPASWDLPGILGLVLQVLGLTQAGIRSIIVEEFGETAGAVFDFVWRYVEALITGGWAGLWEQIQQDLSSLWDTVVDGIKSYLVETIVTQAVLRIATMFNPAGALLNLIVTVWNVYDFLRTNIQRIWGVVTAIVDMIATIAAGTIAPAAEAVEGALARLVPIAISLLANLLGLGGITDKVREVLESLRESVRNAILSLIRRVRGMFSGGGDGDAAADEGATGGDQVLGEDQPASGGGESHTVHIEPHGRDAVLEIRTTPTPAQTWLTTLVGREPWSGYAADERFVAKKNDADGLAAQINTEADQLAALVAQHAGNATPPPIQDDSLEAKQTRFAQAVSALLRWGSAADGELPAVVQGVLNTSHPVARTELSSAAAGAFPPTEGESAAVDEPTARSRIASRVSWWARPLTGTGGFAAWAKREQAAPAALRAMLAIPEAERNEDYRDPSSATATEYVAAGSRIGAIQDKAPVVPALQAEVWNPALEHPAVEALVQGFREMLEGVRQSYEIPDSLRGELVALARAATLTKTSESESSIVYEFSQSTKAAMVAKIRAQITASDVADRISNGIASYWEGHVAATEWHHAWPQEFQGRWAQTEIRIPRLLHNFSGIGGVVTAVHQEIDRLVALRFGAEEARRIRANAAQYYEGLPDVERVRFLERMNAILRMAYGNMLGPLTGGGAAVQTLTTGVESEYRHLLPPPNLPG